MAKPVVVIMLDTWNVAWRMDSLHVLYMSRMSSVISAALTNATPTYSLNSSSRATAPNLRITSR